jgi:Ca2+:H+ antiporter
MQRWIYVGLLFTPAVVIAALLSLPQRALFILSAIGVVPYAILISKATEALTEHIGAGVGGLLNATFGNAAELIITCFAIHSGLLTLVKAAITGSVVCNTLLILGTSLLVGGIRHGRQRYSARRTSITAAMMILAVGALYLPAIFAVSVHDRTRIEELSFSVAGVLLLTYIAFLCYALFLRHPTAATPEEQAMATGREMKAGGARAARERETPSTGEGTWGIGKSLIVLAGAVVGIAVTSEIFVGAIEAVTKQLGMNELFVGIIVVPIIGNSAEYVTGVQMAWRNRLDVTIPVTAGSSTQIALLVAPVLVFLSYPLGHPLDLVFTPLELGVLGLAVVIFAQISRDGESNWLEGVQLLALYLLAGFAFFFLPLGYA